MASTKKYLEAGGNLQLAEENEFPKVGADYAKRLSEIISQTENSGNEVFQGDVYHSESKRGFNSGKELMFQGYFTTQAKKIDDRLEFGEYANIANVYELRIKTDGGQVNIAKTSGLNNDKAVVFTLEGLEENKYDSEEWSKKIRERFEEAIRAKYDQVKHRGEDTDDIGIMIDRISVAVMTKGYLTTEAKKIDDRLEFGEYANFGNVYELRIKTDGGQVNIAKTSGLNNEKAVVFTLEGLEDNNFDTEEGKATIRERFEEAIRAKYDQVKHTGEDTDDIGVMIDRISVAVMTEGYLTAEAKKIDNRLEFGGYSNIANVYELRIKTDGGQVNIAKTSGLNNEKAVVFTLEGLEDNNFDTEEGKATIRERFEEAIRAKYDQVKHRGEDTDDIGIMIDRISVAVMTKGYLTTEAKKIDDRLEFGEYANFGNVYELRIKTDGGQVNIAKTSGLNNEKAVVFTLEGLEDNNFDTEEGKATIRERFEEAIRAKYDQVKHRGEETDDISVMIDTIMISSDIH